MIEESNELPGQGELALEEISESHDLAELLGMDRDEFLRVVRSSGTSFQNAIFRTVMGLEGSPGMFEGIVFTEWSRENLRENYKEWSLYKPENPHSQEAKVARGIRSLLIAAAKSMGERDESILKYVVMGDAGADSALEREPVYQPDIERENAAVGKAYDYFLRDWGIVQSDVPLLLEVYREWKQLQEEQGLQKEYSSSLSPTELAAQKVIERIERELASQGITDIERAQASLQDFTAEKGERPSQQKRETLEERRVRYDNGLRDALDRILSEQPPPSMEEGGFSFEYTPQSGGLGEELLRQKTEQAKATAEAQKAIRDQQYREREARYRERTRLFASQIAESGALPDDPGAVARVAAAMATVPTFSGRSESHDAQTESPDKLNKDFKLDYRTEKSTLLRLRSWDKYNWSDSDRTRIQEMIAPIVGVDQAKKIMAALLLTGSTGAEVRSFFEQQGGVEGISKSLVSYLEGKNLLLNDEDVFKVIYPSESDRNRFQANLYIDDPHYIEDLAWQMAYKYPKFFGENGPYPVLERKVKWDQETKRFAFREVVNPANMIMWLRQQMMEEHGKKSTEVIDFTDAVGLQKQFIKINTYYLLGHEDMFRSKYGGDYKDLLGEFERETISFSVMRANRIEMFHNYSSEDKMVELRLKQCMDNIWTRPIYKKSMFSHMMQFSERFNVGKGVMDEKMGASINTIARAYFHISNPEELSKVLHLGNRLEDLNALFSLSSIRKVRDELAKAASMDPDTYCDLRLSAIMHNSKDNLLSGIFDTDTVLDREGNPVLVGSIKDKKKFINLLNFFTYQTPTENFETIVREIISRRAAEIHGLSSTRDGVAVPWNKQIAEMIAYDMSWFLGVASLNDVKHAGYIAESKFNAAYWMKKIKKGEAGGNIVLAGQLKKWLNHLILALRTNVRGENGNPKTINTVFDEIHGARSSLDMQIIAKVEQELNEGMLTPQIEQKIQAIKLKGDISDDELLQIAIAEAVYDRRDKLYKEEEAKRRDIDKKSSYHYLTDQLIFNKQAMYEYGVNGYAKGASVDKRLRGAKSLKFDKYITYVPLVGATFDQEAWLDDVSKVITDVRYLLSAFDGNNYNDLIWDWDDAAGEMRQIPLGQSWFGQQLLAIDIFMTKGMIDYDKVNAQKDALAKRFMEVLIAGQLKQYRMLARWNTSPRYSVTMIEHILDAVSRISGGGLSIDEKDMGKTKVTQFYFDKKAMARIRKESGTQRWKMFTLDVFNTGLFGDPREKTGFFAGLAEAIGNIAKESLPVSR